jgi:integrase
LAAYARTWIDDYAGRTGRGLDDSTRADYRRSLNQHVLPRLGHHRLGALRPRELRALVRELEQSGQAPASIRKHLAALKALLATAVEDDLLVASPGAVVRVCTRRQDWEAREPRVLSRDDLAALFAEVPAKWELFFRLLLHTGVRISEAIGLLWGDLRLAPTPRLEIRRQVCRGRVKAPKSRYGRREIPLSAGMVAALEDRRTKSRYSGDDDPIFASDSGGFVDASNLRSRILRPAARAARLEGGVGFHAFRHTCASLLFSAGKDLKQVQHWLGHHDPAFTLNTYIHLLDGGLGGADFFDEIA